jgi:membrane-bound lytic murein transglycosylase D
MWQFMPFAGAYGLERNGFFDERFDPEKSTIAYAKYMKYLYQQFGDWYLAMAAYDWGAGNVQRAVARTGYADFWQLYRHNALPGETKNYVPGILAAVIMAKNPKQYGLTDVVPDAPVRSDTVTTEYAINLQLVADVTNSSVSEIVALNPALLRLTTPRDIPYDLHLPVGTKQTYMDRVKDIPEDDRASWRFHVVKDGETLGDIATSLHSKVSEITTVNEIPAGDPPGPGDELVIPVATAAGRAQRYTSRRGDTLVTVADRFGVEVDDLRKWNHLSSNKLAPGRSLYVSEPVRLAPTARARTSRGHGATAGAKTTRGKTKGAHATPAASHSKTSTAHKHGTTGR